MSLLRSLFKSREEVERERKEMESTSYPFGDRQRQTILNLLKDILPEEPEALALTIFLIGKKAYQQDKSCDTFDSDLPLKERLPKTFRALGKQLFGRHREKMARYLALIMADSGVDEQLCYPSKMALLRTAAELEPLCGKKVK